MGRKIPAKKHRGVKDPIEQQARRYQSIKGKINAPPKDPDEQPIPRSLTRLFAFQGKNNDKVEKKKKPKSTQRSKESISGHLARKTDSVSTNHNPIARLKQLPGESARGFSLRINSAIKALHDLLEQDYPQDLEVDDMKGERIAALRAHRQRKRKRAATDSADPPPQKLTRGQKLTLKKNANKLKAIEDSRPEVVYERVSFGDVTHAPPALPAPRRAAPSTGAARPGRRDLLLNSLLPGGTTKKSVLPPAELMRRERARLDVVAAYRELKKQRQMEQSNNRRKKK